MKNLFRGKIGVGEWLGGMAIAWIVVFGLSALIDLFGDNLEGIWGKLAVLSVLGILLGTTIFAASLHTRRLRDAGQPFWMFFTPFGWRFLFKPSQQKERMTHYICTGTDKGVSKTPGVCKGESCSKYQEP